MRGARVAHGVLRRVVDRIEERRHLAGCIPLTNCRIRLATVPGPSGVDGVGAQRRALLSHELCGACPAAGHVADGEAHGPVVEGEGVVPATADALRHRRREVARGERDTRDGG